MKRVLTNHIRADLAKKIVLLTGPRQAGKTTLAKMIDPSFDYFNYDSAEHRLALMEKSWDRAKSLVIFDELHKMKEWKSWLKGVYDTEKRPPALLVTGSAKLDTYRKVGDSLAGRFFQYRLHPLDLKEIQRLQSADMEETLDQLLMTGGFPEPFLEGSERFYKRWKRSHLDIILRQDLVDLENISQIQAIETLIELLRGRVGSPISYSSLAGDLQCSDKTVKKWLTILENMYVLFKVTPYHKNIARSLLKAPKYYFYDTGQVLGDKGVKLENLTACALLKEIHRLGDCLGDVYKLHYLRTKEKHEIDFFVIGDRGDPLMLEVKWGDDKPGKNFGRFSNYFPGARKVQIVKEIEREKTYPDGLEIRRACSWLAEFSL
ncbi:MAG: ATP-binding protein [Thermodesulfobacteriota bacterium]|nr:ATP-binding protein [Thermodesulfobacteriota bacterium]